MRTQGPVHWSPELYAVGLIEAEFEERIVGWCDEAELREEGWDPVMEMGSETPVARLRPPSLPTPEPVYSILKRPGPVASLLAREPVPITEQVLVWRWKEV